MTKFETIYEGFKQRLNEEKLPSTKELLKAFGKEIEEPQAKELLKLMEYPGSPQKVTTNMEKIDKLIGGYGIEVIKGEEENNKYYRDIIAEYVNMGDTYITTILFDVDERKFLLTSVGDWHEQKERDGVKIK